MRFIQAALIFVSLLPLSAHAGPRNQGYSLLGGAQIREAFAGRALAQDGHAPMRFAEDGRVEGSPEARAWSIEGDALCLEGASRACYDVWIKGRAVQMFSGENESEGAIAGVLQ